MKYIVVKDKDKYILFRKSKWDDEKEELCLIQHKEILGIANIPMQKERYIKKLPKIKEYKPKWRNNG